MMDDFASASPPSKKAKAKAGQFAPVLQEAFFRLRERVLRFPSPFGGRCKEILAAVAVAAIALPRSKRAAYELPDGAEFLVGGFRTSFTCPAKNGYFADVDNNCQIFHVCNVVTHADGNTEVQQYSFLCGNQTVFNQLSLTCAFAEEAVPCQNAPDFFYVNDNIGVETAPFLTDNDVQRAAQLIPSYKAKGLNPQANDRQTPSA
ncbi:hypothetical protein MRX96_015112 [Rhipicephalus microplus]